MLVPVIITYSYTELDGELRIFSKTEPSLTHLFYGYFVATKIAGIKIFHRLMY
jgi:hypothetical protein